MANSRFGLFVLAGDRKGFLARFLARFQVCFLGSYATENRTALILVAAQQTLKKIG